MMALAQISETAFVGGRHALSLLGEAESAELPDCTPWRIAFVGLAILAAFLVAIIVWLLLRRRSLGIRWIGAIALAYLSGPSISFVVRSLGVEFSVPGVGWSGAMVAIVAIGAIAFYGRLQHTRGVSDPLAEHIDVVFDGFREGKTIQEMADKLGVPKTQITAIIYHISRISDRLE